MRLTLPAAFSYADRTCARVLFADQVQRQYRIDVPLYRGYVGKSLLHGNVQLGAVEVDKSAPVEDCGPLVLRLVDR